MKENRKKKILNYLLGALQAFIGVSAITGGFGLMSDPSGVKMKLELMWLKDSPFPDYWIPGAVLFSFIGIGNFLASLATFFHVRESNNFAIVLGAFLIVFLSVEVYYVGLKNPLQPLFFILGGIESVLGLKLLRLFEFEPVLLKKTTAHHP